MEKIKALREEKDGSNASFRDQVRPRSRQGKGKSLQSSPTEKVMNLLILNDNQPHTEAIESMEKTAHHTALYWAKERNALKTEVERLNRL